jgi:hypothetical protein
VRDDVVKPGKQDGNKHKLTITMLDPRPQWKGWSLKDVAGAYKREKKYRSDMSPHERYRILLKPLDPVGFPGPTEKHTVICPFCKSWGENDRQKPSLVFSSCDYVGNEIDTWHCFNCGRGGNMLLWARLLSYIADDGPAALEKLLKKLPPPDPLTDEEMKEIPQ